MQSGKNAALIGRSRPTFLDIYISVPYGKKKILNIVTATWKSR